MKIKINGVKENIQGKEISILNLLSFKKVEMPDMVSVQLNEQFIDKEKFESIFLKDNDSVDFLYFMGGGGINNERF